MSRTNARHPQRKSRKPNVARMSREALVAALDATKPEWTPFVEGDIGPSSADECWFNSRYQVLIYRPDNVKAPTDWSRLGSQEDAPRTIQLSIKSNFNDHYAHDWRDLQRIKNEIISPNSEAVELYPGMSRLVDTSNQYHLWVLEDEGVVPIGWPQGDVCIKENVESKMPGCKQRSFEEGFLGDFADDIVRTL